MKKGLIIIDVQNDYFKGGNNELYQPEEALVKIQKLLAKFRQDGLPVFMIQHTNNPQYCNFMLPGTKGVQLHDGIKPVAGEVVIQKVHPSSFLNTNLQEKLQKAGVDELVVCGMMTHMCVDTTVRAAADYEYPVTLISDGCATMDLCFGGQTIKAPVVEAAYFASLTGVFAQIMTCDEYLAG